METYPYKVQFTTHCMELYAYNEAHARITALELAGVSAIILSVIREGEW